MPQYSTFHSYSPEERLYQLIISRLNGAQITSPEYCDSMKSLVHKGIGGFIIFGGSKGEVGTFIKELQSEARVPLFIASDVERGVGQQLSDAAPFPSQMAVAAAIRREVSEDTELLRNALQTVIKKSIETGINVPLIPVMDVNQDPDNPIICTRAFSDDPDTVSWFGTHYIEALEGAGLLSCAKHFPGHGDTSTDSHISLPVITKSKEKLVEKDIRPFISAIRSGVSSIMVGHLMVPAFDALPASLSKVLISDYLRRELGYKGLIMTDALSMSALDDYGAVPVRCMNAGVDILLHPRDADATVQELIHGIEAGDLTHDTVDHALTRILHAKQSLAQRAQTTSSPNPDFALPLEITARSITCVKGGAAFFQKVKDKDTYLVLAGDKELYKQNMLADYFKTASELHDAQLSQGTLVVALFTSVAAWKGSSGISREEIEKIHALIQRAKRSVVISFGSPYVLRSFSSADSLLAAYEPSEQAQKAAMRCVRGEIPFRGKLPVEMKFTREE